VRIIIYDLSDKQAYLCCNRDCSKTLQFMLGVPQFSIPVSFLIDAG